MLGFCTECNQQVDLKIDKKTDQVVCMNCRANPKVTSQIIQAMKNNREYLEETKASFGFRCSTCKEIQPAVSNRDGTSALCTKCGSIIGDVSPFMIKTMRRMGKIERDQ